MDGTEASGKSKGEVGVKALSIKLGTSCIKSARTSSSVLSTICKAVVGQLKQQLSFFK